MFSQSHLRRHALLIKAGRLRVYVHGKKIRNDVEALAYLKARPCTDAYYNVINQSGFNTEPRPRKGCPVIVLPSLKQQIQEAASAGWKAISKTDARTHRVLLTNCCLVTVSRMYHRRPVRVAWSPYYKMSYAGQTLVTNDSMAEFVRVAARTAGRMAQ